MPFDSFAHPLDSVPPSTSPPTPAPLADDTKVHFAEYEATSTGENYYHPASSTGSYASASDAPIYDPRRVFLTFREGAIDPLTAGPTVVTEVAKLLDIPESYVPQASIGTNPPLVAVDLYSTARPDPSTTTTKQSINTGRIMWRTIFSRFRQLFAWDTIPLEQVLWLQSLHQLRSSELYNVLTYPALSGLDPGVQIQSFPLSDFQNNSEPDNPSLVIGIVVAIFVLLVLASFFVAWLIHRRIADRRSGRDHDALATDEEHDQHQQHHTVDSSVSHRPYITGVDLSSIEVGQHRESHPLPMTSGLDPPSMSLHRELDVDVLSDEHEYAIKSAHLHHRSDIELSSRAGGGGARSHVIAREEELAMNASDEDEDEEEQFNADTEQRIGTPAHRIEPTFPVQLHEDD